MFRIFLCLFLVHSAAGAGESLVDFSPETLKKRVQASVPEENNGEFKAVTAGGAEALEVTLRPGKNAYPGVRLLPPGQAWDLSAFGGVEAEFTNLGEAEIKLGFRADNDGDWKLPPWNTENATVAPGATVKCKVAFGYSWGKKGFNLDPSMVRSLLVFSESPKESLRFHIKSVRAVGKPGDKPQGFITRLSPTGGFLFGGEGDMDESRLETRGKAGFSLKKNKGKAQVEIRFPGDHSERSGIFFKAPEASLWNLGAFTHVDFMISNPGPKPLQVFCRIDNKGANDHENSAVAEAVIRPGESQKVRVPFASKNPWDGGGKNTGSRLSSVDVIGALVFAAQAPSGSSLRVHAIRAALDPPASTPSWLGRRPPVPGDWIPTFNEDFDGDAVDLEKWNNSGPNYWDKKSVWSRKNVIVSNGKAILRYERKTSRHNDDPAEKEGDYTGGYLDTYGKWTQRYGYFEARMKLPAAPGLWPAFWMMPDRGAEAGPQWKRQDTVQDGMEFDIMEHLTRWGTNRYNIANHWDGYGKDHKANGSTGIYLQPDREGYITCGLLWEPGRLVYFGNGNEVGRWENPRVSTIPADMMFTLPQGGWDNSPIDDAQLPADFSIDYVRVWQRKGRLTKAPVAGSFGLARDAKGIWNFVDPQGKPFFSKGCGVVKPKDASAKPGAEAYDVLAKYNNDKMAWAEAAAARLRRYGFNSLGAWSDEATYNAGLAFTHTLALTGYGKDRLVGLWSDAAEKKIEAQAVREVTPLKGKPGLIGYFLDNELPWYGDTGWPGPHNSPLINKYLALPPGPDRAQAEAAVKEFYKGGKAPGDGRFPLKLQAAFATRVAERYFEVCSAALQKADPGRLNLGVRFAGEAYDGVIEACGRHVDVVSLNLYSKSGEFKLKTADRVHHLSGGKPLLITEFSYRAMRNSSGNKNTLGADVTVETQKERAARLKSYLQGALKLPYLVGYHWFNYSDQSPQGRSFDGEDSNYGLVDIHDAEYAELREVFIEINGSAEALHAKASHVTLPGAAMDKEPRLREIGQLTAPGGAFRAYLDLEGCKPVKARLWHSSLAKGNYACKGGALEFSYDSGSQWGLGLSLSPGQEDYTDGSANFLKYKRLRITARAAKGAQFVLFLGESGMAGAADKEFRGLGEADGESWESESMEGTGKEQEYQVDLAALRHRSADGNQDGNKVIDIQALQSLDFYVPGGQGSGVLTVKRLIFEE